MLADTTTLILWVLLIATAWPTRSQAQGVCTNGDVRLQGGPNNFEGRVEICDGNQWISICSDWSTPDAVVVCRQLGFDTTQLPIAHADNFYGMGVGSTFISNLACSGSEMNVTGCGYSTSNICSINRLAGVLCADPNCIGSDTLDGVTRLVNGTTSNEGRVETCLSSGFWRPTCDGNWDEVDARVVCKQLGLAFEEVTAVTGDRFGSVRYLNSAYQNVACFGNETRLVDCPRVNSGQAPQCSFAGVVCGQNPTTIQTEVITVTISTQTFTSSGSSSFPSPSSSFIATEVTSTAVSSVRLLSDSVIASVMPSDMSTAPSGMVDPQTVVLLAALLGSFGGVILLLICFIIVIFVVIKRKKRKYGFHDDRKSTGSSELQSVTYVDSPTNSDSKVTIDNAVYGKNMMVKEEDNEPERVLLNPLYSLTKKSQNANRQNKQLSNGKKADHQPYYSEVAVSTPESKGKKPSNEVYYSTVPTERQYATLESPRETKTATVVLPSHYETSSIQPYEIPMIQPYESSALMKGKLASSNASLDLLPGEPSGTTSVPKPHILQQSDVAHQEYYIQEESSLHPNPRHLYDSPKTPPKSLSHRSDSTPQEQGDTNEMTTHVYDTPRMSRASTKIQSAKEEGDYVELDGPS